MDVGSSLRVAIDSGQVVLGTDKTKKMALNGQGKLIVISENAEKMVMQDLKRYCSLNNLKVYVFPGTSMDLGRVCGKPFPVQSLVVVKEGSSDVLELVK
ncbi:50S ribosomal protein L30e [uncultured archaeon]|nr:50S ribosomal protein L30e [uncultured archaeon]